jgi:hypothetical protein
MSIEITCYGFLLVVTVAVAVWLLTSKTGQVSMPCGRNDHGECPRWRDSGPRCDCYCHRARPA